MQNKTAVIILGASEFPNAGDNFGQAPAFSMSKNKIRSYFHTAKGVEVLDEYILDLFNIEEDYTRISKKITDFIGKIKIAGIDNLFIYYVGHGLEPGEFILLSKYSDKNSLEASSIIFKHFRDTLLNNAKDLMVYMILDCCFAATAVSIFEVNDKYNLTLLCSSAAGTQSWVNDRNITMFTESFEQVLRQGSETYPDRYLSLKEVSLLTREKMNELNPTVKQIAFPLLSTPWQANQDISEVKIFPNYHWMTKAGMTFYSLTDIKKRKDKWHIDICADTDGSAVKDFLQLMVDMNTEKRYYARQDCTALAIKYNTLVKREDTMGWEEFAGRKSELIIEMTNILEAEYDKFIATVNQVNLQ